MKENETFPLDTHESVKIRIPSPNYTKHLSFLNIDAKVRCKYYDAS